MSGNGIWHCTNPYRKYYGFTITAMKIRTKYQTFSRRANEIITNVYFMYIWHVGKYESRIKIQFVVKGSHVYRLRPISPDRHPHSTLTLFFIDNGSDNTVSTALNQKTFILNVFDELRRY